MKFAYIKEDLKVAGPHKVKKLIGPYKKRKVNISELKIVKNKKINPLSTIITLGEGHVDEKHRNEVNVQERLLIINKPDEIYYGVNENHRRIIIFLKRINRRTLWVISEGFRPNYIITAYEPNPQAIRKVQLSIEPVEPNVYPFNPPSRKKGKQKFKYRKKINVYYKKFKG